MTALELYRFIQDNNVEWHYEDNNGSIDVIIFPYNSSMEAFMKLTQGYDPDGGIECRLKDGYFAVWMDEICYYFGIGLEEVFDKDKEP